MACSLGHMYKIITVIWRFGFGPVVQLFTYYTAHVLSRFVISNMCSFIPDWEKKKTTETFFLNVFLPYFCKLYANYPIFLPSSSAIHAKKDLNYVIFFAQLRGKRLKLFLTEFITFCLLPSDSKKFACKSRAVICERQRTMESALNVKRRYFRLNWIVKLRNWFVEVKCSEYKPINSLLLRLPFHFHWFRKCEINHKGDCLCICNSVGDIACRKIKNPSMCQYNKSICNINSWIMMMMIVVGGRPHMKFNPNFNERERHLQRAECACECVRIQCNRNATFYEMQQRPAKQWSF